MQLRGSSNSGSFSRGKEETTLSLEYAIKEGSGFDEVRKLALDSTLLVLMGNEVLAEIPPNKKG